MVHQEKDKPSLENRWLPLRKLGVALALGTSVVAIASNKTNHVEHQKPKGEAPTAHIAMAGRVAVTSRLSLSTSGLLKSPGLGRQLPEQQLQIITAPPDTLVTYSLLTSFKPHNSVHTVSTIHHPHHKVIHVAPLPTILKRIGGCESAGSADAPIKYRIPSPISSASGGFQVLDSTWNNYDGYPRAMDAPPVVQNIYAEQLLKDQGTNPWVSSEGCWG
jgi:hypothetical protein